MTVPMQAPQQSESARSGKGDLAIVTGAVVVAALAAVAAQLGLTKAQPLVGAIVILLIAYAFSSKRRSIDLRTVAWGLALQVVFALIVLKTGVGQRVFSLL